MAQLKTTDLSVVFNCGKSFRNYHSVASHDHSYSEMNFLDDCQKKFFEDEPHQNFSAY